MTGACYCGTYWASLFLVQRSVLLNDIFWISDKQIWKISSIVLTYVFTSCALYFTTFLFHVLWCCYSCATYLRCLCHSTHAYTLSQNTDSYPLCPYVMVHLRCACEAEPCQRMCAVCNTRTTSPSIWRFYAQAHRWRGAVLRLGMFPCDLIALFFMSLVLIGLYSPSVYWLLLDKGISDLHIHWSKGNHYHVLIIS